MRISGEGLESSGNFRLNVTKIGGTISAGRIRVQRSIPHFNCKTFCISLSTGPGYKIKIRTDQQASE